MNHRIAFGIRAGIMNDLVAEMSLDDKQLGWINFEMVAYVT